MAIPIFRNFMKDESTAHTIATAVVATAARDAGNTPTTSLRRGLVMGKITASGKWAQYNNAAADGTEVARGILHSDIDVSASDVGAPIYDHGRVDKNLLIGLDANAETDFATVGKLMLEDG